MGVVTLKRCIGNAIYMINELERSKCLWFEKGVVKVSEEWGGISELSN